MDLTEDELRAEIRRRVAELTERDVEEITDHASFVDDLGFDSLMGLELGVGLDIDYGLRLPEDELGKATTLDEAVALVLEHTKAG